MPKHEKPADLDIFVFSLAVTERHQRYFEENYPSLELPTVEVSNGRKYARLFVNRGNDSKSVWAFVNRETGEIFKPAGWSAPAKHARGNVFSEQGGMEAVTPGMPFIKYLK